MTKIKITDNKLTTEILILGHSGAKRVNDIDLCCCSVSTLAFTLMTSLEKLKLKGFDASFAKGFCKIVFKKPDSAFSKAQIIIDTILNGFFLLKETYPQNICLELDNFTKKGAIAQ